jgi:hypothetical protein
LNIFFFFKDLTHRILLSQLRNLPDEQIEIHSNDQNHLSPKLRLPITINKPSPIIIFAKQKFYFSYNTEPNPAYCHKDDNNNKNCQESSKITDLIR